MAAQFFVLTDNMDTRMCLQPSGMNNQPQAHNKGCYGSI